MKVQFELEEVQVMVEAILDAMQQAELGKRDAAALRRWRAEEITPISTTMRMLTEKLNSDIQQEHDRAEVTPIVKPDWA